MSSRKDNEKERHQLQELISQFISIRVIREHPSGLFQITTCFDERFMIGGFKPMYDNTEIIHYLAEHVSHEVNRRLLEIDFRNVDRVEYKRQPVRWAEEQLL
jgi:transcriptional regulator